jgi:hypothetical protein
VIEKSPPEKQNPVVQPAPKIEEKPKEFTPESPAQVTPQFPMNTDELTKTVKELQVWSVKLNDFLFKLAGWRHEEYKIG